jgi:hypothetical protein
MPPKAPTRYQEWKAELERYGSGPEDTRLPPLHPLRDVETRLVTHIGRPSRGQCLAIFIGCMVLAVALIGCFLWRPQ